MKRVSDNRNFVRQSGGSECEVTFPAVAHKGRIIDYSDGVCVLIENTPDSLQGIEVEVRVPDQELEFRGEIAWAERNSCALKAGIRRIDKLRGNLRNLRFPDLLIGTYRRKNTGILEITAGATVKKICIDRGDIIFAAMQPTVRSIFELIELDTIMELYPNTEGAIKRFHNNDSTSTKSN